jgi:hypothetical protein
MFKEFDYLEDLYQKIRTNTISFNTIEEISLFFCFYHGSNLLDLTSKITEETDGLIINILVEVGIFDSKNQIHQAIKDNRLFVNNIKINQKTSLSEIPPINMVNNYIGINNCFIGKTSKTNYDIFYI